MTSSATLSRSHARQVCTRPTVAESLEPRTLLSAALVGDNLLANAGSNPAGLVDVNGTAFFFASGDRKGLYRTDGTAAGTVLVKELPAVASTLEHRAPPVAMGGSIYWAGFEDGELWHSDGTAAGTGVLKDIRPGPMTSMASPNLVAGRATLYFRADDGTHGEELWATDGTEAGTRLVKDVNPGAASALPSGMIAVGDALYFLADDGTPGVELWRTDGTVDGTVLVNDFTQSGVSPTWMQPLGDSLIFGVSGSGLWKSDGTAEGTALVKPGVGSAFTFYHSTAGGLVFFSTDDGTHGEELWRSDGTEAGTFLLKDVAAGAASGFAGGDVLGDAFYFVGSDSNVWRSDGSPEGTIPVAGVSRDASFLMTAGRFLYLLNSDGMLRSDGTAQGTMQVGWLKDVSAKQAWTAVGDSVFFVGSDRRLGIELYHTDVLHGTTYMVKDLARQIGGGTSTSGISFAFNGRLYIDANGLFVTDGTAGGTVLLSTDTPQRFAALGDTLYFTSGTTLWKTDGTPAGTRPVRQFHSGGSGRIDALAAYNGALYLFAGTDQPAPALPVNFWRSDGTPEGTVELPRITGRPEVSAMAGDFVVADGLLFFQAKPNEFGNPISMWRSDGTADGTFVVGPASFGPQVVVDGALLFRRSTAEQGTELWRSDGTMAGTTIVKDILPGTATSHWPAPGFIGRPPDLVATSDGATAYFFAKDGAGHDGLWRTDGTAGGTVFVGAAGGLHQPYDLATVGDKVFFVDAEDVSSGGITSRWYHLWVSDGTDAGTKRLRTFAPGTDRFPFINRPIVGTGGVAYFVVGNSADTVGSEVWRSDGTVAGTCLAADVAAGPDGSSPTFIGTFGDQVYLLADDGPGPGGHGTELWKMPASVGAPPPPPAVAAAWVGGSKWPAVLGAYLQAKSQGFGGLGFTAAAAAMATPPRTLPWTNLDRVIVRFTDPASVAAGDLRLNGVPVAVQSFAYDAGTLTATWTLAAPLGRGRLTLASDPGVVGPGGTAPAGGPAFRIDILPGDANGDGRVTALDELDVRYRVGRSTASPGAGSRGYSPFADMNASGAIDVIDYALARMRLMSALPPAPAGATLFSARPVGLAATLDSRGDEFPV